ncbi:MAG: outer membrane protein assembly factor BamE [Zetaproteobacteria bacterium]|nr:MAG: outer membrane protein assembly factor BamE [Zetaproteobacteria bacterium]
MRAATVEASKGVPVRLRVGRKARMGAIALLAALVFVGCGSKVTQENFDKVQPGTTQEEVKTILGAPTESSTASIGFISGGTWIWKTGDATIAIQFVHGKVLAKQFERKRPQ